MTVWCLVLLFSTVSGCQIARRNTRHGWISGTRTEYTRGNLNMEYESYLGVPYAKPPIGQYRFLPPQTLPSDLFGDRFEDYPPLCPQFDGDSVIGQEDCLYLNIFVPLDTPDVEKLPVMVFIHGGAFVTTAPNLEFYNPELLISEGVILVTMNYRLGVLGFLTTLTTDAPGNLGLRDIVKGTEWLKDNIEDFGGHPERITIFGQSAGSMAISSLLVMDNRPFKRAILESGTLVRPYFMQSLQTNRTEQVEQFAEFLGCKKDIVNCLRNKSVVELVITGNMYDVHTVWQPVVDSVLGPELSILPSDVLTLLDSADIEGIDLIIGSNNADGIAQLGGNLLTNQQYYDKLNENFDVEGPKLFFGKDPASLEDIALALKLRDFYLGQGELGPENDVEMVKLMTDNMYQAGGRRITDILKKNNNFQTNNIYQYIFTYLGTHTNSELWFNFIRPELGACHGDELYYLFSSSGTDSFLETERDKTVSELLVKSWAAFASTGDPNWNYQEESLWLPITAESDMYLNIGESFVLEKPAEYEQRSEFWKTILIPEQ